LWSPFSITGIAVSTPASTTSRRVVRRGRSASLPRLIDDLQAVVGFVGAREPADVQRVAQRRQRVAQFVRERGQEFVFAQVGGDQLALGAGPLADLDLQLAVAGGQFGIGLAQRGVEALEFARLLQLQRLVGRRQPLVRRLQFAALAEQLDQDHDLAAQDLRDHRHHHVVDRAELVALQAVHVGDVDRGDEDDRRALEARMLVDHARGLEAVHAGHVDVEQDQRELLLHQPLERVHAGTGLDQAFAQRLQDRAVREQPSRLVVDQQDVDRRGRLGARRQRGQRCNHWRSTPSSWSVTTGLAR
jgi:hypothetical protein